MFLLGSSDFSARVAAEAGLGFAFAGQINPEEAVPMLRLYRELFQPSELWREPYAILGHNAIAAPTDEEAQRLAAPSRVAFRRLRSGRPTPLPSVEDALAFARDRNRGHHHHGHGENGADQSRHDVVLGGALRVVAAVDA